MAGKQEGLSNTDTKHSEDVTNSSEKSTKGEGTVETAKLKGTVSPNRPQVRDSRERPPSHTKKSRTNILRDRLRIRRSEIHDHDALASYPLYLYSGFQHHQLCTVHIIRVGLEIDQFKSCTAADFQLCI